MQDTEPNVYTTSKFFTRTCFSDSFLAVIASEIVMHARRPYGTLATKIPIPKMMHWRALYLTTKRARKKKTTPREIAITVMISINLSSSILRGDVWLAPKVGKSIIFPNSVFAPILITIPLPRPYLQSVPKKARFFVSKGDSGWEHSVDRKTGSTYPVKGELSTFISIEETILISAGTNYPLSTKTKSPLTSFYAGIWVSLPSQISAHGYYYFYSSTKHKILYSVELQHKKYRNNENNHFLFRF